MSETENEILVITAFLDALKKDLNLQEVIKNAKKNVHVVCVKGDAVFANQLKDTLEKMAGRGSHLPKLCADDSCILDIMLPGQDAWVEGAALRRTTDIYFFIGPQRGESLTAEQNVLFEYTKGAFSPGTTCKATIIGVSPSSERKTFSRKDVFDNELLFLDAQDTPVTIIDKLNSGLA